MSETSRRPSRFAEKKMEFIPMEIKLEQDLDFIKTHGEVGESYCRCCFHVFHIGENKIELDNPIVAVLRNILQYAIKFTTGSSWICESCSNFITTFDSFKQDIIDKQARFSQLVLRNRHEDIRQIRMLSEPAQDAMSSMIFVKQEPVFEMPELYECFVSGEVEEAQPTKRGQRKRKNRRDSELFECFVGEEVEKAQPAKKSRKDKRSYRRREPETCGDCGMKVLNLLNHQIKKHGFEHEFECSSCSFVTKDKKDLQTHMQDKHVNKPKELPEDESQVCPHCAKQVRRLEEHIANIHRGERYFYCDICSFSSYKRKPIESHMLSIHLPKSVKCSLCEFETITMERLKRHIKNQHEVKENIVFFTCSVPECKKVFKNKFNLQCHVKRCHEGEVKFNCGAPGCPRSFFSKSEQRMHYMNCHGPKNVICDECGSSFSTPAMLRKHSTLHREFRYPCTFPNCSLKYRNSTQLKNHVNRIHLDKKDYECENCDAAFYTARDLERHVSSKHLGIRFVCDVPGCKSQVSRRDALLCHYKSHSELSDADRKELVRKLNDFCMKMNLKR